MTFFVMSLGVILLAMAGLGIGVLIRGRALGRGCAGGCEHCAEAEAAATHTTTGEH